MIETPQFLGVAKTFGYRSQSKQSSSLAGRHFNSYITFGGRMNLTIFVLKLF